MSEGLTYETESQAQTVADDYHNQGYLTKIKRTAEGRFKVFIGTGMTVLPEELLPELEEVSGEEEAKELQEEAREERREARRKARRKPEEIQRRKMEAKHKELEQENEERIKRGTEKGTIVEIRDPQTYEIIDYKLVVGNVLATKIGKGIGKLPATAKEFTGSIVEHSSRQMNVKKGMQASIPGQARTPKAIIAALPQRDIGAIGTTRPAIGRMETTDFGKTGTLYIGKSPIRSKFKTRALEPNEEAKTGLTKIPILKNPKEK